MHTNFSFHCPDVVFSEEKLSDASCAVIIYVVIVFWEFWMIDRQSEIIHRWE